MRIDVMLLPNRPWPTLVERARRAEQMGFGALWLADHFVNPYQPQEDWFETWTLQGALAAVTESIRIGTMVSSLTLRNPALLARAAMTADRISEGRIELGIGAAGAPLDHTMTGVPAWESGERGERFREAAEIVCGLLRDGAAEGSGTGSHYPVEGALLSPAPVQERLPITVAGVGDGAIRLAARLGDAWNTMPLRAGRDARGAVEHDEAVELVRARVALLEREAREAGREPSQIRRSYLMVGTYAKGTPEPDTFLRQAEDFRGAGIGELIVYWPGDEASEPALERLAAAAIGS